MLLHLMQKPVPIPESVQIIQECLGDSFLPLFAIVQESSNIYRLVYYPNGNNRFDQLVATTGSLSYIKSELIILATTKNLRSTFPALDRIADMITSEPQ